MEYPEPQRSQVLDFLFKPKFGAAFQHLKVEIGGDMNSTDGTEPSHARTRAELEHPQPECFDRGYEWWLLREARRRNPAIFTDILQWGAPGWIGQGKSDSEKFFSQDNADFIASFIQGARQYHGVDINYCGIWNETPHIGSRRDCARPNRGFGPGGPGPLANRPRNEGRPRIDERRAGDWRPLRGLQIDPGVAGYRQASLGQRGRALAR
jgi:hypothetical protein